MATSTGTDRLRSLIDVLVRSIDEPAKGEDLARRAYLSRFHFDRLVTAALHETPAAFRRRLLLERAAWHLLRGTSVTEAALDAGYSATEAFARAFRRAFGSAPSAFRGDFRIAAPNGIHFHPPGGLLVPGDDTRRHMMDLTDRMIEHDNWLTGRLIDAAGDIGDDATDEPVALTPPTPAFAEDAPSIRAMLGRLVFTKEMWSAAIAGNEFRCDEDTTLDGLKRRLDEAGAEFAGLVRDIRNRGAWGHRVRRRNVRSAGELHLRRRNRARALVGRLPPTDRGCSAARTRRRRVRGHVGLGMRANVTAHDNQALA